VGYSAQEISSLLAAALSDPGENKATRIGFAERNSWDQRAREYLELIHSL
jgi:hypothetical protein